MSETPIFDKLLEEFGQKKFESLQKPFLSPVKPPLPKRSVAQLITPPETDPEFTKKLQEFIQTAPMQILAGTPAGSSIKSMDFVKKEGDYVVIDAEVMVPPAGATYDDIVEYAQRDIAATDAMFNGLRPQMAWVDEVQSGGDDEIYIESKPITFDRVRTDFKTELVAERFRQRQLTAYQDGVVAGRQKAAEEHDDRFTPPMSEKTMPSWIADEIQKSNDYLSDPEPVEEAIVTEERLEGGLVKVTMSENVHIKDLENAGYDLPHFFKKLVAKFREDYPNAQEVSIHRGEELDGTITISVTGTTPEQTDESVNAASNNDSTTSNVKPLWVSNEE